MKNLLEILGSITIFIGLELVIYALIRPLINLIFGNSLTLAYFILAFGALVVFISTLFTEGDDKNDNIK